MSRVRLYNDGGYGLTLREGLSFPVEVEAYPHQDMGFEVPVSELRRVFTGVEVKDGTLYFSLLSGECKEVIRCEPAR